MEVSRANNSLWSSGVDHANSQSVAVELSVEKWPILCSLPLFFLKQHKHKVCVSGTSRNVFPWLSRCRQDYDRYAQCYVMCKCGLEWCKARASGLEQLNRVLWGTGSRFTTDRLMDESRLNGCQETYHTTTTYQYFSPHSCLVPILNQKFSSHCVYGNTPADTIKHSSGY